ncbi:MAG: hypothetical protein KAY59_11380 [Acidobacteria bacterium]|nr:hypothetical protein [Acidobacteriota bacterium]
MGRPSIYTAELAASICERIALGESLRKITSDEGMSAETTVLRWLSQDDAFRGQYSRAREDQGDSMFDRVLDTIGKVQDGALAPDAGRVVINGLQWTAAKLKSKKYGDRQTVEHEGSVDFVLRAPEPMGSAAAWLEKSSSSGSHSLAPKPTS